MVKEVLKRVSNSVSFVEPTSWRSRLLIILAVMVPYILATGYDFVTYRNVLRTDVYERSAALVEHTKSIVTPRLDLLEDLVITHASKANIVNYTKEAKWDKNSLLLGNIAMGNSDVVGVALLDPAGILIDVYPADPSIIGQSRADREWYKNITVTGKLEISGVFKRGIHPEVYVTVVAAPVRDEKNVVVGYLLVQTSLDKIAAWIRNVDVGPGGFTYLIDKNGNLLVHPYFDLNNGFVNYSQVSAVKEVLSGKSFVEITYDEMGGEEALSAYGQIPEYKWGVVVQRPTQFAFADYYSSLTHVAFVDIIVGLFLLLLTLLVLKIFSVSSELRRREKVYLNSISDGMLVIDRNWKIALWNNVMEDFTDITDEEAMGQNFKDIVKLVRVGDKKANILFIEEAMLGGEKRSSEDHTVIVDKGGNEVSVVSSAAPIKNDNNVVTGCIVTLRNTTEELLLEKRKTDLIASVIQELKPPLIIINSVAKQFNDARQKITALIPDMSMGISLIVDASQEITQMVDGLLDEIEGANIRHKMIFDLVTMLKSLQARLVPSASLSEVAIHYEPPETFVHVLVDDPELIERSFAGLLDNAIKFSKRGGDIFIEHDAAGKYFKTIIRDNGLGISKEDMLKIYAPTPKSISVEYAKVPQLGLLTIKNNIEENSGIITIESELGAGTTVSVYLPFV